MVANEVAEPSVEDGAVLGEEVGDPQALAVGLAGVARADALLGGAQHLGARAGVRPGHFLQPVHTLAAGRQEIIRNELPKSP